MHGHDRLCPRRDLFADQRWIDIESALVNIREHGTRAPSRAIAAAVAKKLNGVVITSSSGPIPQDISASNKASEPEAQPIANFACEYSAISLPTPGLPRPLQTAAIQRRGRRPRVLRRESFGTEPEDRVEGLSCRSRRARGKNLDLPAVFQRLLSGFQHAHYAQARIAVSQRPARAAN